MTQYIQIEFMELTAVETDLLVGQLSLIGYEGFEETAGSLRAFIPADAFNEEELNSLAVASRHPFSKTIVEATNWNAVWEAGFEPVLVDDFVAIRASFHPPVTGVQHEIVITPKMSFGTGHHATTFMMLQQMQALCFTDKKVMDFGTGTGVLAILAEKLGAAEVDAIDNDEWSILNAAENIEQNEAVAIRLQKTDHISPGKFYDILLANINRNVILANFSAMAKVLVPGGTMLLSGLLEEDGQLVCTAANQHGLILHQKSAHNNWICLRFSR